MNGFVRSCRCLGMFLALTVGTSWAAETSTGTRSKDKKATASGISAEKLAELDQATYGFADRFVTFLSEGCDAAAKNNPAPDAQKAALRIKLHNSSSAYAIATQSSPLGQLMDLLTMATLGYTSWVQEGEAKKVFGDRSGPIEEAFTKAHEDIWRLAARYLSPEDQTSAKEAIAEWRRKNPNVTMLAYVRFDDFATARSDGSGGRISGGIFAQLAEANRNFDATRQLAERAFFYAQRAPRLLQWQTERTIEAIFDNPEIHRAMEDFHQTTIVLQEVAAEIKRVDERHAMITNVLNQVRGIVSDAGQLALTVLTTVREGDKALGSLKDATTNLTETLSTAGRVYSLVSSNSSPTNEPFDIKVYSHAIDQAVAATHEANNLVHSTESMIESKAWEARVKDISDTATRRVNHAAYMALIVMVVFFGLLFVYTNYTIRLRARTRAEPR